uniref:Uncharacterized protein n=1 Tax=Ditylenchus dipsaci TaxID=166011 RepID=A0A915DE46_9BILA
MEQIVSERAAFSIKQVPASLSTTNYKEERQAREKVIEPAFSKPTNYGAAIAERWRRALVFFGLSTRANSSSSGNKKCCQTRDTQTHLKFPNATYEPRPLHKQPD